MIRWLIGIVLLLAAFAGGVGIGWRAGETTSAKHAASSAQQQVQTLTATVQQRMGRRQQQIQAEQARSTAWLMSRHLAHAQAQALSQEIADVQFPITLDMPGAACSVVAGDLGSAAFQRLYDAAARAGQPAAATSAGGGHRMHRDGTGPVSDVSGGAARRLGKDGSG